MTASLPCAGGAPLVRALSEAVDPRAVLERIVEQALVLLPGAEGTVVELLEDDHLVYVAAAGHLTGSLGAKVPAQGSLSGLAVLGDRILLSEDTEVDPRVDLDACRRVRARSMVCVPLVQAAGPVGVLKAASSRPACFGDRDIHLLARLADFITTAVSTATEFSRSVTALVPHPTEPGEADQSDPERDEIARFVANVVRPEMGTDVDLRRTIESVLREGSFEILYQPIVELETGNLIGAEALARFTPLPYRPPNLWFADAERAGLGVDLELAAIRAALAPLPFLPEDLRLSVNVGPRTIGTPELADLVGAAGPERVVLELTEHLQVEDYPDLRARLAPLRERNTLLAIDDTGAGISSLTHVLKLAPDLIKLDREITSGIDLDPVRRALTSALMTFAGESGALVVAEGIETGTELKTLLGLGVRYGQGFHLGRPAPSAGLRHSQVRPIAAINLN